MTDVVVVGGGPAGSACALLLAREGFIVHVLEKRTFPRAKPCGDCISPGANPILKRLGVWDDVLALNPARLRGWLLECNGRSSFSSTFAESTSDARMLISIGIERARFDSVLLNAAKAAGAQVTFGARVTDLLYDGGMVAGVRYDVDGQAATLPARLTIGADGLRSRVARLLRAYARPPRLRKVSLTAHVRGIRGLSDLGEMHLRDDACLGIAPVQNSADPLCNITMVLPRSRVAPVGARAMLHSALLRLGRDDIAALVAEDTEVLASGPFDWPVRRVVFPGAALVGDAAGYFDPFTGQGIYQALAAGEQLARHAAGALRTRVQVGELNDYARAYRRITASARRLQHAVDYVCARPRVAEYAFRAFSAMPYAAARLIGAVGDIPRKVELSA